MFEHVVIPSPKQSRTSRVGWDAFFPYYAGYPASFARSVIGSMQLDPDAVILDPWNGSGTTTQVASRLGYCSIGCDINPAMVIVSRARGLLPADGDSIAPLAKRLIERARELRSTTIENDPLLGWFDEPTAESIRSVESSIREHLVGDWTIRSDGTHFDCMSSLGATFYVALFLTCRSLVSSFQSSNPTWLRRRKPGEAQISLDRATILSVFQQYLESMSTQLAATRLETAESRESGTIDIHLMDSTRLKLPEATVDFVLTSPPYCTRIDYTAATRIELGILAPLLDNSAKELSRQMIGSTRVPVEEIAPDPEWGETCNRFLGLVRSHRSKASAGYYYKTHLDYFAKMFASLDRIALAMKKRARALLVVQDSYYKDVYNNLPVIVAEMAASSGLQLIGSKEFRFARSMSGVNPYTRLYERRPGAIEAVLGFERS